MSTSSTHDPVAILPGRLRPERDTPGARRRLLLVTVLAKLMHLPRSQRTVKAISPISIELATQFGLRNGLSAKSFERDDALDAIYRRARFGRQVGSLPDAAHLSPTAMVRADNKLEAELRAVIKARDKELRDMQIFNVVACVLEFRKQIGV